MTRCPQSVTVEAVCPANATVSQPVANDVHDSLVSDTYSVGFGIRGCETDHDVPVRLVCFVLGRIPATARNELDVDQSHGSLARFGLQHLDLTKFEPSPIGVGR